MGETRVIALDDGRELAWTEYGSGDGLPVLAFHGSPGTRWFFEPLAEVAADKGVRLIAPDRPGYGHSTLHRSRTYETWARDVGRLADHLHLDRFAVVGHSSGGPNAVGCARFLAERVMGCAIVSGPAPPEAKISKLGMLTTNRLTQRFARMVPRLMGFAFEVGLRQAQRGPDKALAWMSRTLPPCDAAIIEQPEFRAAVYEELARPVAATAGRAATQDLVLELRPWRFRLEDVEVPTHVWHGDIDRNVLVDSGVYQANLLPHATLHRVPDSGHWLVYSHFADILDSVAG